MTDGTHDQVNDAAIEVFASIVIEGREVRSDVPRCVELGRPNQP